MRNINTGALEVYDISNNHVTFAASLGNFGTNMSVAGFGNFSGVTGETDMMMRGSNGHLYIYDMGHNAVTSGPIDLGGVGLDWSVYGFGNFSSNPGETDLIMRNANGAFELYDISHNAVTAAFALGAVGTDWVLAGFGNFSGNSGETDMLLRNTTTGALEVYDFAHNQIYNAAPVVSSLPLSSSIDGTGPNVSLSDIALSSAAALSGGASPASASPVISAQPESLPHITEVDYLPMPHNFGNGSPMNASHPIEPTSLATALGSPVPAQDSLNLAGDPTTPHLLPADALPMHDLQTLAATLHHWPLL